MSQGAREEEYQDQTFEQEQAPQEQQEQQEHAQTGTDVNPDSFTPRMLEACVLQGVMPESLIRKTRRQVIDLIKSKDATGQNLSEDIVQYVTQHLEDKRLTKLDLVRQTREQLKESGSVMSGQRNSSQYLNQSENSITLVEKQNRLLENIRRRQQQELEKMIENELRQDAIRQQNAEKEQKQRERELQQQEEVEWRRKLAEQKRKQQEEERKKKEQRELLQAEGLIKKSMAKEQHKRIKEKEKQDKLLWEQQLRDYERRQREEKIRKEQMEFAMRQSQELEKKRQVMEEKDQWRVKMLEMQTTRRQRQAEQDRQKLEAKLDQVRKSNDYLLEKKRFDYERRQMTVEQKRREFEEFQSLEQMHRHSVAQKKQQEIMHILKHNELKEEEKRNMYFTKVQKAEQKKDELQEWQTIEQEWKQKQFRDKELKISTVLKRNEDISEQNKQKLILKLNQTTTKLQRIDQKNKEDTLSRFSRTLLKEIDTQDNLEKMEQLNRMKKARLEQKLQRDEERREIIAREKDNLIKLSESIRKEAEEKRQKYMHDFELSQKKKNGAQSQPLLTNRQESIEQQEL